MKFKPAFFKGKDQFGSNCLIKTINLRKPGIEWKFAEFISISKDKYTVYIHKARIFNPLDFKSLTQISPEEHAKLLTEVTEILYKEMYT